MLSFAFGKLTALSAVRQEYSQPDRGRVRLRPFQAMTTMGRKLHPGSDPQVNDRIIFFNAKGCGACDEHHELVFLLIVPEVQRAHLPGRNDALEPNLITGEKGLAKFFGDTVRYCVKKISPSHGLGSQPDFGTAK